MLKKLKQMFTANRIHFFLIVIILFAAILISLDWVKGNFYNDSFWDNVLIEAHGMLFDLLIFGVLITIYESLSNKRHEIIRLKEEIEDFRGWKEPEAMYRICGNIKRLNRLGIHALDLNACFMEKVKLHESILKGSRFTNANFEGSDLYFCELNNSKIIGVNFKNAILTGSDFSNSDCQNSEFENAFLGGVNFYNSHLSFCNFKGAKFNQTTNLENAYVDESDWLEKQADIAQGFDSILSKYHIDNNIYIERLGFKYYLILRKTDNG